MIQRDLLRYEDLTLKIEEVNDELRFALVGRYPEDEYIELDVDELRWLRDFAIPAALERAKTR